MKLFYRTFKKAIFDESNRMVYIVKKKWLSTSLISISNETIATFSKSRLFDVVLFNNKEYTGRRSFFTNKVVFDNADIEIMGNGSFFSSGFSSIIRQAQIPIAVIRRDRGRVLFQEYEIEIYNPENEKLALGFLMPAIETLNEALD